MDLISSPYVLSAGEMLVQYLFIEKMKEEEKQKKERSGVIQFGQFLYSWY